MFCFSMRFTINMWKSINWLYSLQYQITLQHVLNISFIINIWQRWLYILLFKTSNDVTIYASLRKYVKLFPPEFKWVVTQLSIMGYCYYKHLCMNYNFNALSFTVEWIYYLLLSFCLWVLPIIWITKIYCKSYLYLNPLMGQFFKIYCFKFVSDTW